MHWVFLFSFQLCNNTWLRHQMEKGYGFLISMTKKTTGIILLNLEGFWYVSVPLWWTLSISFDHLRNAVSFWNINFISESIPAADSSGTRTKQIEKLNEASAEITQSNKELEKVKHTSNTDEACQQIQSKVDVVLQSCANQHQVSKEVYTENMSKDKLCHWNIK